MIFIVSASLAVAALASALQRARDPSPPSAALDGSETILLSQGGVARTMSAAALASDLARIEPVGSALANLNAMPMPLFTVPISLHSSSNWSADGFPRATFGLTTNSSGDPWVSPDAVLLGGTADMATGSLYIRGMPYGPLDLATNLSVVQSDRSIYGARAGVGPDGIATTSAYYDYDAVNFYNQAGSQPARFIASAAAIDPVDGRPHAVTYVAGKAFFSPPLPTQDLALLRPNMHVMTNSTGRTQDRANSPAVAFSAMMYGGGKAHPTYAPATYGGQILPGGPGVGWAADGSWIAVDGWVVIHSGNASRTQVPSTTYDTLLTHYHAPALLFGIVTKSFNSNVVCNLDPLEKPAGDVNAPKGNLGGQVTQCEGAEWDITSDIKQDYLATLHGLTIQSGAAERAGTLTEDSYNLHLGGPMPHQIVIDERPDRDWLLTNGSVFNGDAGPMQGTPIGARSILWEMDKYPNGAGLNRLVTYLQRDVPSSTTTAPFGTHSLHLAAIEGGKKGDAASGAQQGQIVFGGPNLVGGVALCPFGLGRSDGSTCPLSVRADSGVVVLRHPRVEMRTPSSSSAPCVAGEFTDDASYHYVCVSKNKWRRVALGDF